MRLHSGTDNVSDLALLVGIATGIFVVLFYFAGGLIVAEWSITDFLAHLTLETILSILFGSGLTVAVFAIPIIAYLRYHIVTPIIILAIVLLGWTIYSTAIGLLTVDTIFGLGLYAIGLSPLYMVVYVITGGTEYYIRSR